MAISGDMSTTNQYIKYRIEMLVNSQSVTYNRTNVTVRVKVRRTNVGYQTYGTGTVYCTINGTQYTSGITSAQKIDNEITVFSKTLNIPHGSDGKKTLAMSARIVHSRFSSSNQSWSQTLATIPRASTITSASMAGSIRPGQTQTINIKLDKKHSSFSHYIDLRDSSGNFIGEWQNQSNPTSLTLNTTHITRLLHNMRSTTNKTFVVRVQTTSSGHYIGSRQSKNITVRVSSTVVPEISNFRVSIEGDGHDKSIDKYVQGISRARVRFDYAAVGETTLSSWGVLIEGKNYPGSVPTSDVLRGTGSIPITANLKDRRGRAASETINIQVEPYQNPRIEIFKVNRVVNTDTAQIERAGGWANLEGDNECNVIVQYKESTEDTWINIEDEITDTGFIDDILIVTGLSDTRSYDFRFTLVDDFNRRAVAELSIGTAIVTMSRSPWGIGVGMVWEEGGSPLQVREGATIDGHPVVFFADYEEWEE